MMKKLKAYIGHSVLMTMIGLLSSSCMAETHTASAVSDTFTIELKFGSGNMVAILEHNPTARDFVTLLPLTFTVRDFGAAEKVSGALPQPLSVAGAPARDAGRVGDIAYYSPWNNIAFYRGQGPEASGVIKIATIVSGIEALKQHGELKVTISLPPVRE